MTKTKITITSSTAVHGTPAPKPTVQALSLASSAATMWPLTAPTILFPTVDVDHAALSDALAHLVGYYPLLGARLTVDPPPGHQGRVHTRRYGRAWAEYGTADEPGAQLAFATWDGPLADVLPTPMPGTGRVLDVAGGSLNELCDCTQVAVVRPHAHAHPGPVFAAQLTLFRDGVALAVRAQHAILDAHSAIAVIRAWLDSYNALVAGHPLPVLEGTFAPALLDSKAAGDIEATEADPTIVALAETLPGLKLDMARSADTPFPLMAIHPAPGAPESEGPAPPWSSWEWQRHEDTQQYVLRFSASDVDKIHQRASGGGNVSRLDSVFGLVWGAIVRARALPANDTVSFGLCIGLRNRVTPPLGDEHYGPNLLISGATLDAQAAADLPTAARAIRSSINKYTPETIAAELHRMAYASDPVRRWNLFFGSHNYHSSSWLRLGAYTLELGDVRPCWVQSAFPGIDGLVIALEAGPADGWEDGVNIQVFLDKPVMDRLVEDPTIVNIQPVRRQQSP